MKTFTALVALASVASAHMIMRTPQPAGNPNSSPLASMAEYPCKGITSEQLASGPSNPMTVGESNQLSFTGSAVHGGGSCQVSIASGTTVSKDMKFMVIHSIEGGCPADAEGNLATDPSGTGAATFSFTIPEGTGLDFDIEHTLAWTWNNKIGNREFYMNCAKVKITDAKKKRYAPANYNVSKRQQSPLPDVFIANLGNGCSVAEGTDVQYPNPGDSVEVGKDAKLAPPTGSCGAVGNAGPPAGSSASAPAASSSAAVSNSVAPAPSATGNFGNPAPSGNAPITQSEGGNFATQSAPGSQATPAASQAPSAASQVTSAVSKATSAATVVPSVPASTAASASAPIGTGAGSSSGVLTGPCTDGDWNCVDNGSAFQRCGSGQWTEKMSMSAGTTCVVGTSANFAYNVSGGHAKRDLRTHVARRRHNLQGGMIS